MEPDSNPNSQVFSHEKVITPHNSDIKPEESAITAQVAPTVNNQLLITPTPASPVYPSVTDPEPTKPPQPELEWKPPNNIRKIILEALFVFGIAAVAGTLFHLWYKLSVRVLPNSVSVCSNASHDAISFACHGTLFGNFFAFITLFSLVSYISYRLINKSNTLAFYYGGFFVASLFFVETSLVFDYEAIFKLRWLFAHTSFWNLWLTPALVAGLFTLAFYLIIQYTKPIVKTVLGFLYAGLIILSLIFMPSLVNNFVGQQSLAGRHESENQVIENVKNSDIKIYAPRNYKGPLKLYSAQALIANPELIPRYELNYNFLGESYHSDIIVDIYKGSTNEFNPPTNCGDGSPSSEKHKSTLTYACKVVLKTKRGREVYGYRSPSKLQYYKIDPNSDDIKKIQPYIFYIPMGDDVISFSDSAVVNVEDNESPLTPTVVEEFVDSLEPLTGAELEQFTNHYILFKS